MTVIAGYTHKGHVWLGGDSLRSNGHNGQAYRESKVFRNGDFLIGATGSVRVAQLLRYSFSPPEYSEGDDIMAFMVNDFVESIRTLFRERGVMREDEGEDKGGEFLVGYRGQLYHIESDFQVGNPSFPFDACGSGEQYAHGAMYATKGAFFSSPEKFVTNALRAASEFAVGCAPPYHIVTTDPSSMASHYPMIIRE